LSYDDDLVGKIITSDLARRMLGMVTEEVYDHSRTVLWLFEVIGQEYDEMAAWSQDLRFEAFVQTCSWSISIWEQIYGIVPDDTLDLEFRRQRVMAKRLQWPPINPARIEAILSALTGATVEITEFVAPYTFKVTVSGATLTSADFRRMMRLLRQIKPSHLTTEYVYQQFVRFVNCNSFWFKKFGVFFPFKNRTVPGLVLDGSWLLDGSYFLSADSEGFRFVSFGAKLGFHNYGLFSSGYLLDGSGILDGSWLLNSGLADIFSGIKARRLELGSYSLVNRMRLFGNVSGLEGRFVNEGDFEHKNMFFSGLAAHNNDLHNLSGTLIRNGYWVLDGSLFLNGSRKLDSFYLEEVL